MWFRTCCGILQVLSPPHLPLMKTQLHPPSLPNLHMDRHNSHALVQLGQGGPCGYAADARCHDHMTRNLFRVFFSPVPSLTFPSLSPPRSGPPAKEFGGVLAVKHGRSQAWARGGALAPWKCRKVLFVLQMLSKSLSRRSICCCQILGAGALPLDSAGGLAVENTFAATIHVL